MAIFLRTSEWRFLVLAVALVVGVRPADASIQDDEDFFPGLLARYTSGGQSVSRIDEVLSFDWGAAAADSRLSTGPFTAEWTGKLLSRSSGQHVFHAFVAGDVVIKIDDQPVLNSSQQWGFDSGEVFELSAGEHDIHIFYSTAAESDKPRARLNIFWSSDSFTLEPLPADVLYREATDPDVAAAEHGRRLFDSLRCAACHRDANSPIDLPILKAPSLDRVIPEDNRSTLTARLSNHAHGNSRMPNFDLNPTEQESVVEYLFSVAKKSHKETTVRFKEGDVDKGFKLLNSLGCVACHSIPDRPQAKPRRRDLSLIDPYKARVYDGPTLHNVGRVRSVAWIDRWLKDPASLNADHRMPAFDLSSEERRQLVAALAQTSNGIAFNGHPPPKDVSAAAGQRIIQKANCAACHRIPGIEARAVAPIHKIDTNFKGGCLEIPQQRASSEPAKPTTPGLRVPSFSRILDVPVLGDWADSRVTDREALAAWVNSGRMQSSISVSDRGGILLQRNGCTACHDRNNVRGLSAVANRLEKTHPALSGQSQGLIPPSLTAVGDKLNDDYLQKAVAGEQNDRRLPWLLVRMPKFKHSDADRSALVHHLIATDRVPVAADNARQDILAKSSSNHSDTATPEELLLGNQLTGAGGFNCVACHQAGPFQPRNVALGTRGSDIMTMGSRLRPRFFKRWMKNPIRVVAGIEMPAIKKAMPDVLNGSLNDQINVIWTALSDKRFTPPTVTTRFEQVVNVQRGGAPRIIRDVFTIGTGKDTAAVARAMAIGFGNGHNILIDLNTMLPRLWTIGEFARQRTEGKSWYWDMPGISVQRNSGTKFAASLKVQEEILLPIEDEGRFAELLSYRRDGDAIELTCAWRFVSPADAEPKPSAEPHFSQTVWERTAGTARRVVVRHRFEPIQVLDSPQGDGWKHGVTVLDAPIDSELTTWLSIYRGEKPSHPGFIPVRSSAGRQARIGLGQTAELFLTIEESVSEVKPPPQRPIPTSNSDSILSTPGFQGNRLPIDRSIMPTSMAWLNDGRLAFTSLKGQVWIAEDTDKDGLPDKTSLFEEGLAAPFGILTDGDTLIVAHKPEVLRLRDSNGDGRADERQVIASGWGYNDNYHDWTSGLIRDDEGNLYLGLGSDYSQKQRPVNQDRWRGGVIKIDPSGIISPLGMSMRYPMSLAIDNNGNLFATDNQGVQNTFNEINHIQAGKHYGVPSAHQPADGLQNELPALMVPHPWTRSVNSILFLPDDYPVKELRGHGIGCEYDSRFLMRFTIQDVGGTLQGASYRFSLPDQEAGNSNFIGPICSAVSPAGEIYIGSIWDSGWQGGQNTGGISRLIPSGEGLPNGIRQVTATKTGFDVEFFSSVDADAATSLQSWSIQGYTRKWGGNYATPDSGRYTLKPSNIAILDGNTKVQISTKDLRSGYVYDLSTTGPLTKSEPLWPSEAHYSMKVVPN